MDFFNIFFPKCICPLENFLPRLKFLLYVLVFWRRLVAKITHNAKMQYYIIFLFLVIYHIRNSKKMSRFFFPSPDKSQRICIFYIFTFICIFPSLVLFYLYSGFTALNAMQMCFNVTTATLYALFFYFYKMRFS